MIRVKPDLAEGWTYVGLLNDKLGDSIKASKYYKKSIDIFNERISKPSNDKYLKVNRLNRAWSYILLGDNDKGKTELNKLLIDYPNDNYIKDFIKLKKQDYINQLFKIVP